MFFESPLDLPRDFFYFNRELHSKLIPTIDSELVIGVRIPELRKFAKELWKNHDVSGFLNAIPYLYYEENNLHAFLIEMIKENDVCVQYLDAFLLCVDNWATCDMLSPKVFKKR